MAIKKSLKLNIHLIERKDEYLFKEKIETIIDEFIEDKNSNNFLQVNPTETEPITIIRFMNNKLFGLMNKLLILQCADLKTLERKMGDSKKYKKKIPTLFDEIISCLEQNKNIQVIIAIESINKKSKIYNKIDKVGYIIEHKPMTSKQYLSFAKKCVSKYKVEISEVNLKYLLTQINDSCAIIDSELCKLSLLDEEITKSIINECVLKSRKAIVFELINSIADKKINLSYRLLNELLDSGTNAIQIIALLQRNLHFIYYSKCKCDLSKIGVNRWSENNYKKQAHSFELDKVLSILELLLDYEALLKSNKINNDKFLMEMLVFECM